MSSMHAVTNSGNPTSLGTMSPNRKVSKMAWMPITSMENPDASTPTSVAATHVSLLSFVVSAHYKMQGLAEHVCPFELVHQGGLIRASEGKLWCTEIMDDSGNDNLDGVGKSSNEGHGGHNCNNEDMVLPGLLGGMALPMFDEMPLNSGEEEISLFSKGFDYPVFDYMPLDKVTWDEESRHNDLLDQLAPNADYFVAAERKPTAHPISFDKLHMDVVYDLFEEMSCKEEVAEKLEQVTSRNAGLSNCDVQDLPNEISNDVQWDEEFLSDQSMHIGLLQHLVVGMVSTCHPNIDWISHTCLMQTIQLEEFLSSVEMDRVGVLRERDIVQQILQESGSICSVICDNPKEVYHETEWKQGQLLHAVDVVKDIEREFVQINTSRSQWANLVMDVDSRLDKTLSILRPQALTDYRDLLSCLGWPFSLFSLDTEKDKYSQILNPLVLMNEENKAIYSQSFQAPFKGKCALGPFLKCFGD
jgi:hypothetical protein